MNGIHHKDGPLAQVAQMADWAEVEARKPFPDNETLRKIATNLRASVAALNENERTP